MKRLLAIFVVLLLVLGSLFWWRKSESFLTYDSPRSTFFPFFDNYYISAARITSSNSFGVVFEHTNFHLGNMTRYQDFFNLDNLKSLSLKDYLWNGKSVNTEEALLGDIESFGFKENILYFKQKEGDLYPYGCYIFYEQKSENFKEHSELLRFLKSNSINIDLKTPEEWLTIWKRDGRLPWFPEHVER